MSGAGKQRLIWFDANRAFAAMGVVLIHSSTDFAGKPFANAEPGERLLPVFFRSLGEFSSSEMFFMFSLFLMAMRVDKKMPEYSTAMIQQAKRLLIPFAFWVVFYAFFRLLKADTFNYAPYIWDQLGQTKNWVAYFLLGNSQYQLHFVPTLFVLFMFYPVMRLATRYPVMGLSVFVTLGVMNYAQGFVWSLDLDPLVRAYLIRALKIFGYVGYGFAAFAIYGLWNDGIPRGESRLIRRAGFYFALLAYVATLPFYGFAVENGDWGIRSGWDFYGHFLMPIFVFFIFVGGQFREWSPRWSVFARYTFGIYLVHPLVIDLFDITIYSTGMSGAMSPWMIVMLRFPVVLLLSLLLSIGISRVKITAWTIGLGAPPWELLKNSKQADA